VRWGSCITDLRLTVMWSAFEACKRNKMSALGSEPTFDLRLFRRSGANPKFVPLGPQPTGQSSVSRDCTARYSATTHKAALPARCIPMPEVSLSLGRPQNTGKPDLTRALGIVAEAVAAQERDSESDGVDGSFFGRSGRTGFSPTTLYRRSRTPLFRSIGRH